MRKLLVGVIIFFVGFACCLMLTHGLLRAQDDESSESDIMTKLNDIAKGQEELATVVNSIKEDIAIIKIRITQMQ
jgi:hypothetical protein